MPNKVQGKINSDRLKAEKIQPKYIKKLIESEEVEIEGKTYRSADFKDPDSPSPVVVIIDCPTLTHLDSLLSQEKIIKLFDQNVSSTEENVKVMVHLAPIEVLQDKKYADFVNNFQNTCNHIFVNEDLSPCDPIIDLSTTEKPKKGSKETLEATTVSSQNTGYRHFLLNNIMARYFPGHFPIIEDIELSSRYSLEKLFPQLPNKSTSQKLLEYVLVPTKNEGYAPVKVSLDKANKLLSYTENTYFTKKYQKWLKLKESDKSVNPLFKDSDPELVFLGTQSMIAGTYCNVSGIYLRFVDQNDIGMIFDCGEGSYSQLLHHYGSKQTRELLKKIKVVYLTHIHGDHHKGLLQLIRERDLILKEEGIMDDPLFLIMPFNLGPWVSKFSKYIEKLNFIPIFHQHIKIDGENSQNSPVKEAKHESLVKGPKEQEETKHNEEVVDKDDESEFYDAPDLKEYLLETEKESLQNIPLLEKFLKDQLGITKLKSVTADHCPQSFGVYLEHQDGWKFVYTGDTKPCEKMVQEVKETTILVHEATFTDDLRESANMKMHSTDVQAIEIGMKLKAWRTILTHFSPRYGTDRGYVRKKPETKDEFYVYSKKNVVRAYDHMSMRLSQLESMPLLTQCMVNMFEDV